MNSMLEFTSDFWNWYISVITVVSLIGVAVFLYSQRTQRLAPGQKAEQMAHKWDGDLVELNNPLPSWWVKLFWITLIFAAVYLVLFPGLGSFKGVLGWSSWNQYEGEMQEAKGKYDPIFNQFLGQPLQQVAANKEAHDMGQRLFMTYCSQCHQSDGKGAKGFPNLTDSDWLYGGTPEAIEATISNGRAGVMPPWEAVLGADGVKEVANYVMSLSGKPHDANLAAAGKAKFEANCVACHGADGKGMQALGAPNLTDKVWLYGGSEAAISDSIAKGRNGNMPAQLDRLGAAKVHLLAAYVWGLGGGVQQPAVPTPASSPEAAAPATALPASVSFAVGSAELAADAKETLKNVADFLNANASSNINLSGYVDKTGNPAKNAELAKQRAKAVQAALVDMGVAEVRINLKKPSDITSDNTAGIDARRVEITLAN